MPRLDTLLVERGLIATRSRARAMILAGMVEVDGIQETRPGRLLDAAVTPRLADSAGAEWVSRGALKLIAALDHFRVDPAGAIGLDIGASTGGFTEVLLARGVCRVYAVDVGHDQFAPELRADGRVVVLERLNARALTTSHVPEPVGIITCDASFIGLETILPAPLALAGPGAILLALIKPQFEVGPGGVGKGGIVRDPALAAAACRRIEAWLDRRDWRVDGTIDSPILGGDGNREFLVCARRA